MVGFVWEGADLVNAVISLCRGHFKEAGLYCVSAFLPVAGDLMVKGAKGVKGLSSLGMDLASGAARSSDEVIDTLCLTYRATDNAADLGRYVDDVVGMIPADGSARLLDGMELLDGKTRIVYEAYDGAGNLYTYTRNLDELADLPGGRGLADGAMDQWGNGRTPRDMVMQGNAPGNMADDLHMYGMADGTGGRPQYDLYANNRPGGAATGGAKTGDTLNDATQQAARRADDAADAGRAAGSSGGGLDVDNHVRGNEGGTSVLQTGGRQIDYNAYIKRLETIDMEYENIRINNTDIARISQNTGMPEWKISRIKEHVFSNEHILDSGLRRFDADPEIADAWYRLTNGTFTQNDIDLLNHEYFESKFESFFRTDYRTAHSKTEESGRIWDPYKEDK